MSSASRPETSRVFTREVSPETIRTWDFGRPRVLAMRTIRAALAAPSVGAVVTRAFR
jgi:hypothetical protein